MCSYNSIKHNFWWEYFSDILGNNSIYFNQHFLIDQITKKCFCIILDNQKSVFRLFKHHYIKHSTIYAFNLRDLVFRFVHTPFEGDMSELSDIAPITGRKSLGNSVWLLPSYKCNNSFKIAFFLHSKVILAIKMAISLSDF